MKFIKYLLFLLISTLLILAAIEGTILLMLNNPRFIPGFTLPVFKDYYYHHDRRMIQFLPRTAVYHPDLFYTLKPGKFFFSNREFSNTFYVNSKGMRDKGANLKHPKILFLGDSFTMGWGVEQRETFPYLVEKALNKKSLNTGISSFGTARETLIAKPFVSDSLEVLVVQYCHNDYEENLGFIKNNYELQVSSLKKYRETKINHVVGLNYKPLKYLKGITYFTKHRTKIWITKQKTPDKKVENNAGMLFYKIIQKMELPENVKIIAFSLDVDEANDSFSKQMETIIEDNQLQNWKTIDFSVKLDKKNYYRLDGHLNASGHEIVAMEISKTISVLLK